ncbi:MAG: transposase [Fibromonadaceae bacterium]|nr:transposase [Fibromonadaceae bacterium]
MRENLFSEASFRAELSNFEFAFNRMAKVMYSLADEHMEEAILDRRSFCQFLGIYDSADVPDSRTIWHFKEQLGQDSARKLLDAFGKEIAKAGFAAKKGGASYHGYKNHAMAAGSDRRK